MRVDDKVNPATQSEAAPAEVEEPNPFSILDEEEEVIIGAEEEGAAAAQAAAPAAAKDEKEVKRELQTVLQLSPTFSTHIFHGLAGEPVERMHGAFGITFDFLSKNFENGLRFLAGAYFRGFKDNMAAGARLGFAVDVNDRLTLKVPFGLGWVNASGTDDDAGNVPIELTGTGVNADQTAYTFAPHDVNMSMQAGMLSFDPELSINFHRWKLGGGKTVGLGAFVALSAALYAGALTDDECSYAYDPSEGDLEVRPGGNGNYEFSNTAALEDRCRSGEAAFGTVFSGTAGLTLEFGI